MKTMQIKEVFADYQFIKSTAGRYRAEDGYYPALGIAGSLDIKDGSILHLKLQPDVEKQAQELCLNNAIDKVRIHVSARVVSSGMMLVFVSDLIHEFVLCQVPELRNVDQLIQAMEE